MNLRIGFLKQFGSLASVFEAKHEELMRVDGIGENAATLIKLIPEVSRRYLLTKKHTDEGHPPQRGCRCIFCHQVHVRGK